MHTDDDKKYRETPASTAACGRFKFISALCRMISHSAVLMKPMPPISAAS
jgi:hypothetical protein